jgi:hypothetical protein
MRSTKRLKIGVNSAFRPFGPARPQPAYLAAPIRGFEADVEGRGELLTGNLVSENYPYTEVKKNPFWPVVLPDMLEQKVEVHAHGLAHNSSASSTSRGIKRSRAPPVYAPPVSASPVSKFADTATPHRHDSNSSSSISFSSSSSPSSTSSNSNFQSNVAARRPGARSFVRKDNYVYRFECNLCSYGTDHSGTMKQHKDMHAGVRFQCPSCPHRSTSKKDLQRHIRTIHEKRKDFKCPVCDKGFAHAGNLKVHRESVHEGVRYLCPGCNQTYGQRGRCLNHIRLKHGQHPEMLPVRFIKHA